MRLPEISVLNEITKPVGKGEVPSMGPLIEYLRSGAELSAEFRKALAEMLDPAGGTKFWLTLRRRDNRRVLTNFEVERNAAAYRLVVEITGYLPNDDVCKEITDAVPRWTFTRTDVSVTFHDGNTIVATLAATKLISRRAAILLAATAFNTPFETLKQTVARIENALGV